MVRNMWVRSSRLVQDKLLITIDVLRVSLTVRRVRTCSVSFPWLIRFLVVTF